MGKLWSIDCIYSLSFSTFHLVTHLPYKLAMPSHSDPGLATWLSLTDGILADIRRYRFEKKTLACLCMHSCILHNCHENMPGRTFCKTGYMEQRPDAPIIQSGQMDDLQICEWAQIKSVEAPSQPPDSWPMRACCCLLHSISHGNRQLIR